MRPVVTNPPATPSTGLQLLALATLALASRATILRNGFAFDDFPLLVQNPLLTSWGNVPEILGSHLWRTLTTGAVNYYRPVLSLAYLAVAQLLGVQAWAFHLFSVLVHVGATLLVFRVARVVLAHPRAATLSRPERRVLPLVVAALFAVHPTHTEAVAWACAVQEPMVLVGMLLSTLFFLRARRGEPGRVAASTAALVVALGTKELALVTPALLFGCAWLLRGPSTFRHWAPRLVPHLVVVAGYLGLRVSVLGEVAPLRRFADLDGLQVALSGAWHLVSYLGKTLIPVGLRYPYVFHPVLHVTEWRALVAVLVTVLVTALAWRVRRSHPVVTLGLAWTVVALAPVLYVPVLGEAAFADRYVYVPSFGLLLAVCVGAPSLRGVLGTRVLVGFALGVVLVFTVHSVQRGRLWREEVRVTLDAAAREPDPAVAHTARASELIRMNKLDDARLHVDAALATNPTFAPAHHNLGVIHAQRGDVERAADELLQALLLDPGMVEPHVVLARIHRQVGNVEEATRHEQDAERLRQERAASASSGVRPAHRPDVP
ncbi:MAG: tetratricopeptide repeat protein [Myxococcota bacterium]